MNERISKAFAAALRWTCLAPVIGLLYIYSVAHLVANLDSAQGVLTRGGCPHIFIVAIVIGFLGFGLCLGGTLLLEKEPKLEALAISLLYSTALFFLACYLTVMPSMSSCHCVTWRDGIWKVRDWSQVELGFFILALTVAMLFWRKHECNRAESVCAEAAR